MKYHLHIIKHRTRWWLISALVILISLVGMGLSWQQLGTPLRPGLDFAGGTRIQVSRDCDQGECDTPIDSGTVREMLAEQGLETSIIQVEGEAGQTVSIRSRNLTVSEEAQLRDALESTFGPLDQGATQIDSVGPVIGRQLFASGLMALLVSFAGIVAYLSIRFQPDYALLAIVALGHDVIITLGLFAWLGLLLNVEVNSLFIVAVLTVVGFSVNDTVVIYDRIREILKPKSVEATPDPAPIPRIALGDMDTPASNGKVEAEGAAETDSLAAEEPAAPALTITIGEAVDQGVNQTLSRSVNTTLTTLLPLVSIVFFGGETLKFFALALIVGFLSGVYSSVFIASTLLAVWREKTGRAITSLDPSPPAPSSP